jgi:hypothetical protein
MTNNYRLEFSMKLEESSKLLVGKLELWNGGVLENTLSATSSYPGKQYPYSWREKGGVIPPDEPYQMETTPIYMPEIRGVEGNFYRITPFETQTIGDLRGDFGGHNDKNAPGSLGCIVFPTALGWKRFQEFMKKVAALGVRSIPLKVSYN